MSELPTYLITEDDDGHAFLMEDSLRRAGLDFLHGQLNHATRRVHWPAKRHHPHRR